MIYTEHVVGFENLINGSGFIPLTPEGVNPFFFAGETFRKKLPRNLL